MLDKEFLFSSQPDGICKIPKISGEITKLDSGCIASFTVSKDKVFFTDISKIYTLGK